MSDNVVFSAKQLKFIDWLATTKYDRKPTNQVLLAEELGLNPRTLTRWKKIPELQEAVLKRTRELLGDRLPEIYGALGREAEQGSFQHIKLAMEMLGEYTPTERRELGGSLTLEIEGLEQALSKVYGDDDHGHEGTE